MGLAKIWKAIKGAGNEAIEAVEDTQAIRILEQEIREAKSELEQSNRSLTSIAGKKKLAENKVASLQSEVAKYTDYAVKASENGDETLALECAEKVAELESELSTEQAIFTEYQKNETSLKTNIKKAKHALRTLTQQIDQVKANAQVQKAREATISTTTGANSKMSTALTSLDRIKAKQAEKQAQLEAAEELAADESGSTLDAKLKAAGLAAGGSVSAKAKLDQLLAKK